MSYLSMEIDGPSQGLARPWGSTSEVSHVRICNDDAENGHEQEAGPLTWLNSARITTDPGDDAVHCVVSVGDPRGGFCMTIRRLRDGRILIHLPHPGESGAHVETREMHPGTLELGHDVEGTWFPVNACDEKMIEEEEE